MRKFELNCSPEELQIIHEILHEIIPGQEVWAFGSRVNGHEKKFSDLDLLIKGPMYLPDIKIAQLRDGFSESNLPYRVDISQWEDLNDGFKEIVQKGYVVLQVA